MVTPIWKGGGIKNSLWEKVDGREDTELGICGGEQKVNGEKGTVKKDGRTIHVVQSHGGGKSPKCNHREKGTKSRRENERGGGGNDPKI